jgi:3-oxoacyl-[acyl-carrier protein] reductase
MDLQLEGRKVFVTGSTRGIGLAIAERFVAEGASVAICARNAAQVAETARALEVNGAKVFARSFGRRRP